MRNTSNGPRAVTIRMEYDYTENGATEHRRIEVAGDRFDDGSVFLFDLGFFKSARAACRWWVENVSVYAEVANAKATTVR